MNITDFKIIGLPKGPKSSHLQHADIYPLGYMDQFHKFFLFEESQKEERFPPMGKIFAFNFKTYNNQYLDKFITFYIQKDPNYDETESHKSKYRLDTSSPIESFGMTIINEKTLHFTNDGQKNRNILREKGYDKEECYIQSGENLYKISVQENPDYIEYWKTSPMFFDENADSIHILEEEKVIYNPIKTPPQYIDIVTDDALRKFFESAIKRKYPEFLESLTKQKEWKEIFSGNLNIKQLPAKIISTRLENIKDKLHKLVLSKEALDTLYADSRFKETIDASISALEDQYFLLLKKENKTKVKEIQDNTELETKKILKEHQSIKSQIDTEIEDLAKKKKQLETKIKQLEKTNQQEQEKYDNLLKIVSKNKQQLIDDFTIIKEVLNQPQEKQVAHDLSESYIIEEILPDTSATAAVNTKDWRERLEYYICQATDKAIRLSDYLEFIACHKIIMVPDINLVLPLLRSINNVNYIVQNVGIDWKNFSALWQNGLQALWTSCRQNSETLHFMILQNMNLSYLPCYMQPLNDLLTGLRTRLPYSDAVTGFPENLRIIGTTVSGSGGLPIYEKDICLYGCLSGSDTVRNPKGDLQEQPADKYVTLQLIKNIAERSDPEPNIAYYVSGE